MYSELLRHFEWYVDLRRAVLMLKALTKLGFYSARAKRPADADSTQLY
ncbi:MAG: hypothetical protein V7K89_06025 [Nostoc sp.]